MNKTAIVEALVSVVEMVKGQMKNDSTRDFTRKCEGISFDRRTEQEKHFVHESLVEAAEYIYNLETGMILISYELQTMTTKQKIQLIANLAYQHMFEMTTLKFTIDQVWKEINVIFNNLEEMVA